MTAHTPITDKELEEMKRALEEWRRAWERRPRPALIYQRAPDWIQLVDRRKEKVQIHAFPHLGAAISEHCGETERSVPAIAKHIRDEEGISASDDEILGALQNFCDLGLMVQENDRYFSLALPANPHW